MKRLLPFASAREPRALPVSNFMQNRKAAVPFILITILLDMLGIGIVIPVLPKLVASMYGGSVSDAAWIFGWFVASYALMQFIFAPILGNLSDAFGRRPVILISLLGSGLDYLLMAFAPTLPWLFLGRVLSGISGANIAAANAYIADVSPPEDRAKNFGYIGMCFGLGFIIGPALGGLLGKYGLRVPFFAAAILTLLNWLYGLFVLPESHAKENRRPFAFKSSHPLSALKSLQRFPIVLGLAATLTLERIAHDSLPSTWVLYTTYRFNWTELQNGLSLALVGVVFAIVQATLTGTFVGKFGERKALLFGLVIGATAFLAYGLATQGWMMYAIIICSGIGGVAGPALQGLISRSTPADEQGAVQGALSSIQGIAAILGPLLATGLFGFFTSASAPIHLPGAAFIASAILVAIGAIFAYRAVHLKATETN